MLRDGRTLTKFVEQSTNVHRPLSNDQLTEKFVDQAVLALPRGQVDAIVDQCWRIDALKDAGGSPARATINLRARGRRASAASRTDVMRGRCATLRVASLAPRRAARRELRRAAIRRAGQGDSDSARRRGVGFLPLLVMRNLNLIEKHAQAAGLADLKVRWIDLGGPAVMNDALLSGSVDFIAAGPPAFITLWDRTRGAADVRGVAGDVIAADVSEHDDRR